VHVMEQWLRRAKEAGIEFVVVSPLKSDAPEFLGAQWIAIRPNTDTALMLAMAHTLLSEGRHDKAFLQRYCVGFDTFERYLRGYAEERRMGRTDPRDSGCDDPRSHAPRCRHLNDSQLRLGAAARAPRRAALLGDDRTCCDAGPDRHAGRRLRVRSRLDERREL